MRRSAAPSQKGIHTQVSINSTITRPVTNKDVTFKNVARNTSTIVNMLKTNDNNHTVISKSCADVTNTDCDQRQTTQKIFYNVVYGKKSTRKHKIWQDDGILEVSNTSAVLKDLDGKILGRTVLKQPLEDGAIISMGSNDVQIVEACSPSTYQNTQVNIDSTKDMEDLSATKKRKPFESPLKSPHMIRVLKKKKIQQNVDPLVMPCPPVEHSWICNTSNKTICEVIVDPTLTQVLRPHQRQGVTFLYKCVLGFHNPKDEIKWFGAILADEMGLGKTLQTITLIWTLLKQGPYGGTPIVERVLIVSPSSLVMNWKKEFEKWLNKLYSIKIFLVDSKNKPIDYINNKLKEPIFIISYDMLRRYFDDVKNIKFDLIICDEAHRLKNTSIKSTSLLSSLDCRRRILLTGTPIQNDLREFYSLVNFVNPDYLGSTVEYKREYEDPISASRDPNADAETRRIGEEKAMKLNEKTNHFILRRTQQINNKYLPTKHEIIIFNQISEFQKKLYEIIIEYWDQSQAESSVLSCGSDVSHLAIMMTLKKLCNHPSLISVEEENNTEEQSILHRKLMDIVNNYDDMSIHDSGKLHVLDAILQKLAKTGERIIVVSYFTQTLDMLQSYCEANDFSTCRLDGSTSTSQRMAIVEKFNNVNSNIYIFLLSARAGGEGLNLTGASRLILYDSDWNPANDLQAMSRIWRDGQKNKHVYIYRLITAGTIEEKIFQRQIFKAGLSGAVVDATNAANDMKLSNEELKDLFSLHEDTLCITHQLLNCSCECDGIVPPQNPDSSENTDEDDRDCQLEVNPIVEKSASNLRINELSLWEHYAPPINDDVLIDLAIDQASNINFIFKHKIVSNCEDNK